MCWGKPSGNICYRDEEFNSKCLHMIRWTSSALLLVKILNWFRDTESSTIKTIFFFKLVSEKKCKKRSIITSQLKILTRGFVFMLHTDLSSLLRWLLKVKLAKPTMNFNYDLTIQWENEQYQLQNYCLNKRSSKIIMKRKR